MTESQAPTASGKTFLKHTGIAWFTIAVIGQWFFVLYIALYFGPLIAGNGLNGLAETHLPHGYISGDMIGNFMVAAHILLAIIIIGGGPLQLIPYIRKRFPAFHRINGRIYLVLVFTTSIAGLFIVWTRGVIGGFAAHIAISLDAVLIMAFGIMTLRFALARRFEAHHRWALRLFMVVNAVWFFRIGLMLWILLTGGAGIDMQTFTGPAVIALYFGQMIVPLVFLEIYFRAQSHMGKTGRWAVCATLIILTGLTACGSLAAILGMWLPRMG